MRDDDGDEIHIDQRADVLRDDFEHVLTGDLQHRGHDVGCRGAPRFAGAGDVVETRVLDRDAGGGGERHHQLFIVGGERRAGALCQVEVAVDLIAHADRNAQERIHVGVVRGKAHRARVGRQVLEPDRRVVGDHGAEQSLAGRQVPDVRDSLRVDADVDEALQPVAVGGDDAEGAVAGVDESHRGFDDAAQHHLEVQALDDRGGCAKKVAQPPLGASRVVGVSDSGLRSRFRVPGHRRLPSTRV